MPAEKGELSNIYVRQYMGVCMCALFGLGAAPNVIQLHSYN